MGPKQIKFMSSQFQQNNRVTLHVHTNQQIKAQKISRKDMEIIVTSPGDLPQAVFFVLCFYLPASFSAKPPSSLACSLLSKLPLKNLLTASLSITATKTLLSWFQKHVLLSHCFLNPLLWFSNDQSWGNTWSSKILTCRKNE